MHLWIKIADVVESVAHEKMTIGELVHKINFVLQHTFHVLLIIIGELPMVVATYSLVAMVIPNDPILFDEALGEIDWLVPSLDGSHLIGFGWQVDDTVHGCSYPCAFLPICGCAGNVAFYPK